MCDNYKSESTAAFFLGVLGAMEVLLLALYFIDCEPIKSLFVLLQGILAFMAAICIIVLIVGIRDDKTSYEEYKRRNKND